MGHPDNGIGRLLEPGVGHLVDPNVLDTVKDGRAHT
jgi:hypothetical protein